MTSARSTGRRAAGFALLEALIAVGILAFGLVAIARLQMNLVGNSDLAKQRSEAVQLGQQRIEDLRAYSTVALYQGMTPSTTSETITGKNATYTRSWTITDSAIRALQNTTPVYKDVLMTVSWKSRANTDESVTLRSVVALDDPATSGMLTVPPSGSPTHKPKNRDMNIPWDAVKIGGGRSALHPVGAPDGFVVIFNDADGQVVNYCTTATLPGSDNLTATPTSRSSWNCAYGTDDVFKGGFLTGFIGYPGTENNDPPLPPINFHLSVVLTGTATLFGGGCWDDMALPSVGEPPMNRSYPWYPDLEQQLQHPEFDTAVANYTGPERITLNDTRNDIEVKAGADPPLRYFTHIGIDRDSWISRQRYDGYVTYACLIDTGSSSGTWSGTTTFSATSPPPVDWGNSSGQWYVCRYIVTAGEPYPYVDVDQSLLDQNYVLRAGGNGPAGSCPSGTVQHYP